MRQMSLKLKNYAGGISIIDNSNLQKRALYFLCMSFGILGFFYILILSNMVFDIIKRKNFDERVRVLLSEVGGLELSYLSLSNNIDLPFSYALGFKETNIKFATRKTLGSLKMSQNEI